MWISLVEGFFSVVECADDSSRVAVRARVKGDLVALRQYVPTLGRIHAGRGTDYPYRSYVSKEEFAAGLARAVVEGLRYRNYKGAVHVRDPRRAALLTQVWSILRGLE
ncbi:MAG: hypothetical protein JNJ54_04625 [Myxococcaceae bacterium]|nr:hypothetical protein [Myxococcaceae bacterium]